MTINNAKTKAVDRPGMQARALHETKRELVSDDLIIAFEHATTRSDSPWDPDKRSALRSTEAHNGFSGASKSMVASTGTFMGAGYVSLTDRRMWWTS